MSDSNYLHYFKIVGLSFATLYSTWALRRRWQVKEEKDKVNKEEKEIHEVFFFSAEGVDCRTHMYSRTPCSETTCSYYFVK